MLVLAVHEVVVFVGAPCRQLTWLSARKYMWQFIVSLDFQYECNCNCNSVALGRLLKNLKKNGGKHVLPPMWIHYYATATATTTPMYTSMLIFCSIVIYVLFEYACFRFLLKIQLAFDLKCEFGLNEPVICRLNFYSFWVMYWEFWSFGLCSGLFFFYMNELKIGIKIYNICGSDQSTEWVRYINTQTFLLNKTSSC